MYGFLPPLNTGSRGITAILFSDSFLSTRTPELGLVVGWEMDLPSKKFPVNKAFIYLKSPISVSLTFSH